MKGLSQELILELAGKSRTRNQYGPKLVEFEDSDEAAVNVADSWPIEFGQKQASTLYQGFLGALKKADLKDTIEVKQSDGAVFLLHKERVALVLQNAASQNGNEAS